MDKDVVWMRLSAVLHVDELSVDELSDGTEFHADCSALGLCGDPFPIVIYLSSSDAHEIAAHKELLQPGALLVVKDEALDVIDNTLRMMGPTLVPFSGERDAFMKSIRGS